MQHMQTLSPLLDIREHQWHRLQAVEMKHGKHGTYCAGCRCDLCCTAESEYNRRTKERNKAILESNPDAFEHGTAATYRRGCRCDDCRDARKKYTDELKKKSEEKTQAESQPMSFEEYERRRISNDRWRERARLEAGLA